MILGGQYDPHPLNCCLIHGMELDFGMKSRLTKVNLMGEKKICKVGGAGGTGCRHVCVMMSLAHLDNFKRP